MRKRNFPNRERGRAHLCPPFERYLIVSDSHRDDRNLKNVLKTIGMLKGVFHLGDSEGTEEMIRQYAGEGVFLKFLRGNCDFNSDMPLKMVWEFGHHRALFTHGHLYSVNMGFDRLLTEAKKEGADLVFFGHTHVPVMKSFGGVTFVNPGSISRPRQAGGCPSFLIMEVRDGEISFSQRFL